MIPVQPVAPIVRETPSKPSPLSVQPSQPASPAVDVTPSRPSIVGAAASVKLNVVTVKPGDSLWKLAEENLGKGLRWHDLLAVNPAIVDASHIVAGSQIFLPAIASRFRSATRIIVQKGDTLTAIAYAQFGHASYWSCIAEANPAIRDANVIYKGQSLLIPGSCKP